MSEHFTQADLDDAFEPTEFGVCACVARSVFDRQHIVMILSFRDETRRVNIALTPDQAERVIDGIREVRLRSDEIPPTFSPN